MNRRHTSLLLGFEKALVVLSDFGLVLKELLHFQSVAQRSLELSRLVGVTLAVLHPLVM